MSQSTLARPSTAVDEVEMELTDDQLEAVVGGLRIPVHVPQPVAAAAA